MLRQLFCYEVDICYLLKHRHSGSGFMHYDKDYLSLYYYCRISLSNNMYQAIRLPTELTEDENFYLGKSINGIYCASIFQGSQLQVWFLNDQYVHGQTEWVLKHGTDIFPILPNLNYDEQCDGAWILQEFYYWGQEDSDDEAYTVAYSNEAILEEKFVWALTMIMFSNQEVGARILLSIFLDFIHTKRLSSSVINSTGC